MFNRNVTGATGERLAGEFLKKRGYRILETNYRCPHGEIDIIARNKDCLVFIEVRTKASLEFGTPEESISPTKMSHLRLASLYYRQSHKKSPEQWRIDFVAVELDRNGKPTRIELIENAVGE